MNIVNTLTLRHIKTHKKRSILTIMAIIVSVAMVTAVFTSAFSFVNYFKNVMAAIDGTWHSYIVTDEFDSTKGALETDDIERYGVDAYFGSANVDDDTKSYEMEIYAVDKNYLDMRNVKISEGSMPKATNEILVHKGFMDKYDLNWKIGDKVTLNTLTNSDEANLEYTVVGITESNVAETDTVNAFVYATDDYIKAYPQSLFVYVQFSKMDKEIYSKTEKLAEKLDTVLEDGVNRDYRYNYDYLVYSGCGEDNTTIMTLFGFCAIILVIIAVVSIFMIYDSFAVSYQERARYLGMLASVGATKKQKRNSIYFEGFILGLIGIPLGIIAGIGGIWVTFKAISNLWINTLAVEYNGALTVHINWIVILATVIASALTIFVSSYIPAIKASKTTAIDAIRQTNTVKVKNSKRLKTSKLSTKLFGFEGTMAIKNYKRNGRRSRTIVFALFMSVVVFLSVSNFSMMFSDVMKGEFVETSDLSITVPCSDYEELEKALKANSNIDEYFSACGVYSDIDKEYIKDEYKNNENAKQLMLIFVNTETIDSYAKQLGIDKSKFHDKKNPAGILHNEMVTRVDDAKANINPFIDLEGKNIECNIATWNAEKGDNDYTSTKINIAVQTEKDFKNSKFYYQNMHIPMLMLSVDLADTLLPNMSEGYTAEIVSDNTELVEEQILSVLEEKNVEGQSYNASAQMKSMNNILTITKVFIYGFITLITMISIMNIINTISNSMNERRREFAMIRSVGMTPKSFKKMIYFESLRYGIISLMWALPISALIHFGMYKYLSESFDYGFKLHPIVYIIAVVAVFLIIGIALLYSVTKIKDDNIIETLKQDID